MRAGSRDSERHEETGGDAEVKLPEVSLLDALASAEVFVDGDWIESKDQDPNGDVRLIQLADVGDGEYINKSARFLTSSKARALRCTHLKSGDVLLARMPDPLGRACIFPGDSKAAVTVVDVCIIRPNPRDHDARWLMHCLNAPDCRNQIAGYATGTTRTRISRGNLGKIRIPHPPLAEQRRIAKLLDSAEALQTQRRAALTQLDSLTQSIFIDLFGDPVTNPKGWPSTTLLGDVAETVSGITKGRKLNGEKVREVPYLAVANVQDRALYLDAIKSIEATEKEIARHKLQPNDLVLTEGGDPDKLGRGTLWNGELPECIHQNHIFRVRFKTDQIAPLFANWLISGPRGKRYFLKSAKQTTGIASINMKQLRGFPLLIPPLKLQHEFVGRVTAVEALKEVQQASLAELDALFATLQHRAFRGEL
jgi:type I restriction enzyme S subunit